MGGPFKSHFIVDACIKADESSALRWDNTGSIGAATICIGALRNPWQLYALALAVYFPYTI